MQLYDFFEFLNARYFHSYVTYAWLFYIYNYLPSFRWINTLDLFRKKKKKKQRCFDHIRLINKLWNSCHEVKEHSKTSNDIYPLKMDQLYEATEYSRWSGTYLEIFTWEWNRPYSRFWQGCRSTEVVEADSCGKHKWPYNF